MNKNKKEYISPVIEVFSLTLTDMLDNLSVEGNAPNYNYGGDFEGTAYYEW